MARANNETLQQLQPLLIELRKISGLDEKTPGIFYVKRVPMLHFHDGPDGLVADLKRVTSGASGFDRFDAANDVQRRRLLKETILRCTQIQKRSRHERALRRTGNPRSAAT